MGSTLTNLLVHFVFSTKGREPMIIPEIRDELHRYMGGIIKGEGGMLLEIGGMPDHIHIVIKLRPVSSLSTIMRKVKGKSSKWLNEQKQLPGRFSWQDGYGAFSVSESQVSTVIRYVKEQEKHHQVEYDERYLWA
ncbi:IS200/IS605 family transposase [Thermodesulfobacteriota bacterium]